MTNTIKVQNSGIIKLQQFKDMRDGTLFIAESQKNIPFVIKRVYFISKFFPDESIRGKHSHKKCQQVLFCISGSFKLHLDDGTNKQTLTLNDPATGILLGTMLWHEMTNFSPDCTILVFASQLFKESDYVRDYQKFLRLAK